MVSHGKRTSGTRLHARTNQQHPKCELLLQLRPAPTGSYAQVCQTPFDLGPIVSELSSVSLLFFSSLLLRHISMTLPASFRGKNTTRPDYEHQNSNLYAISGQKTRMSSQHIAAHTRLRHRPRKKKGMAKKCLSPSPSPSELSIPKTKRKLALLLRVESCCLTVAVNKKRHLSELSFSAMDGVPFMISEKFACASSDVSRLDWVFFVLFL